MSSESTNFSVLARSKHMSSRDNCSLRRWVLLQNSIIWSSPCSSVTTIDKTDVNPVYYEDDEVCIEEEADSFMFPDASRLNTCGGADAVTTSEAEWLDSLLETLGDEVAVSPWTSRTVRRPRTTS